MADGDEQELRVVDNRAAMRYEVWSGNDLAGFSTYRVRPGRLDFIHTETEAGFEGHGVAGRLVHDALEDLRTRRHYGMAEPVPEPTAGRTSARDLR